MKKNKGFTLVELLAVIVVLAIIMFIAIPAVFDKVNDVRQKSFALYANKVFQAAQNKTVSKSLTNQQEQIGIYNISSDLGSASSGDYKGYVVANNCYGSKKYYITMWDGHYLIQNIDITGLKDSDIVNMLKQGTYEYDKTITEKLSSKEDFINYYGYAKCDGSLRFKVNSDGTDKVYYKIDDKDYSEAMINGDYVDISVPIGHTYSIYEEPKTGYTDKKNTKNNPYSGVINSNGVSLVSAIKKTVAPAYVSITTKDNIPKCNNGRTLSNGSCTYYYKENASQCGQTPYECGSNENYDCSYDEDYDCSYDENYDCSYKENYTYDATCTRQNSESVISTGCCDNSVPKPTQCKKAITNCSCNCAIYDGTRNTNTYSWTEEYTCKKTGTRTVSKTCTRTVSKTCTRRVNKTCTRYNSKTCYTNNSCTKTENNYREYYCPNAVNDTSHTTTNSSTSAPGTCTYYTYTCPDGYGSMNAQHECILQ